MKDKKHQIRKAENKAFGKKIYLLGMDKDGIKYWLEEPKWDCGWYWGFGYVETYTNNDKPHLSRDIDSHQHIDSSFMGELDYYDTEKNCWRKTEYIHNIFDCPKLFLTTFTENEGWKLSELFKKFYLLKKTAEFYKNGSAGTSSTEIDEIFKDEEQRKKINEVLIPKVTAEIIKMLSPTENEKKNED